MIAKLERWWSSMCFFFYIPKFGKCEMSLHLHNWYQELFPWNSWKLSGPWSCISCIFLSPAVLWVLMSHGIRKAMDNCSTFFHAKVDHSCISCDLPLLYCVYLLWLSCFTFFEVFKCLIQCQKLHFSWFLLCIKILWLIAGKTGTATMA
jgi:hypothetical protein